jgi:OOP family OmpA-OmpF porin
MSFRASCVGLSIPAIIIRACLVSVAAFSASPALATWAEQRSTPHLLDLVAIDRTGEQGWLFGREDVAGDGFDRFEAAERGIDLRTAYAAGDAGRLWLRAYVSSESAPPDDLRVFFFIDTDRDAATGGDAVAPEIDAAFTRDTEPRGYDVVVGMRSGTELGGVWRWDRDAATYALLDQAPLDAVVESGTDIDRLNLAGARHGYLQVSLDSDAVDIRRGCEARLLVRSTADAGGDLDVGVLGPCIAADGDRNRVGDLIEVTASESCDSDDQCPASGLCLVGRCLFPSYCRVDADCANGERCGSDDICRAQGGETCAGPDTCEGGLVCDEGPALCRACSDDDSCASGERCAASGRCVNESSSSGSSADNDLGIVLERGQEIQGGAGTCGLGVPAPRRVFALLAFVGLAALGLARRRRGVSAFALVWLLGSDARAQVDAERLKPAVTHDGWVNAEGSRVRHPDDAWELGALLNYAYHPLIIADADGSLVDPLIAGRAGLDLLGSVSFGERFALGLGLPLFMQHGQASPSRFGVGDLRVVPKLELASDIDDGVGFALAAEVRAPTHGGDFSGGARGFAFFPKVIVDHRYPGGLRIGANLGVLLREDQDFLNLTSGDEFAYVAAAGYRFGGLAGKTELGVELNGAVNLADAGDEEVALEALGFLRHALSPDWELKGGAGAGVLEGYGVPTWRVFIGATFTPTSHDRDYDGVPDSKDQCVEFAEDRDAVQDADGCPEEDADADQDGVSDDADRCPTTKETINGIQDDDGCPDAGDRRVIFDDGEFVVLDTIRFNTGSADVHPSAHSLLDQVALTLRANPEIQHIRIEGHTDDTGPREVNMVLSQQRALAVKHYLVQRGVSPRRLTLKSYGPDKPRQTGTDNRARASNRRVEFIVE